MRNIAIINAHAPFLKGRLGIDEQEIDGQVTKLAEQLAINGFHVDIFTPSSSQDLPEILELTPNVRIIQLGTQSQPAITHHHHLSLMDDFAENIEHFIDVNDIHYELIHAHLFTSAWAAYRLKRALDIPYIVTFYTLGKEQHRFQHTSEVIDNERIGMEAVITTDADALMVTCPESREQLIAKNGADPRLITLVPAALDQREYGAITKFQARKQLGLQMKAFVVLHRVRTTPYGGSDVIAQALTYVLQTNKGQPIEALQMEGDNLSHTQLLTYYAAADVVVDVPSYDVSGIVPLEAMASGVAIIGSRVGAIRYSVINGKTGILIPPQNPLALAHAIKRLKDQSTLRNALGLEGKRRVRQFFNWQKIGNQIIRLYERVRREYLLDHQHTMRSLLTTKNFPPMPQTGFVSKAGRSMRTQQPVTRNKHHLWLFIIISQLIRRLLELR